MPGFRVFVGNLASDTTQQDLHDLFKKYGNVTDMYVAPNDLPTTYGFVSFVDSRSAEDAVRGRHGWLYDRRELRVEMANSRGDGRGDGASGGGWGDDRGRRNGGSLSFDRDDSRNKDTDATRRRGGRDSPATGSNSLYVGNLPMDVTRGDLEKVFDKFGELLDVYVPSQFTRAPAYGFVRFRDSRDAQDAMNACDGMKYKGDSLRVEPRRERDSVDGSNGFGSSSFGSSDTKNRDRKSVSDGGAFDTLSSPKRRDGVGDSFKVVVSGLPKGASWQDLKDHMRSVGDVAYCDVDRCGGGVVQYHNQDDMIKAARKLNKSTLTNKFGDTAEIRVELASGSLPPPDSSSRRARRSSSSSSRGREEKKRRRSVSSSSSRSRSPNKKTNKDQSNNGVSTSKNRSPSPNKTSVAKKTSTKSEANDSEGEGW